MSFSEYYEKEWMLKDAGIKDGSYDRSWRSRWEFAKNNISIGSSVLDVACGDSVLGEHLVREKNCDVSGIDLCEYAIRLSAEKGIIAKQCDISSDTFPYDNESFDYITMLCCLEHVIDPAHAIMEALRVLKRNGKLIITLPNAVNIGNRICFLFGSVPINLLHIKPGEGMHIQFFNYKNEFEDRILGCLPNKSFKIVKKIGDVKNPQKYNKVILAIYRILIKICPNMFSQYTHWIIEKL